MLATRRWVLLIAGFVLVTLAYRVAGAMLLAPDGSLGPTMLQAVSPAAAAIGMLAATAVAGFIAVGVARMESALSGLAVMGAGMCWWATSLSGIRGTLLEGSAALIAADGMVWTLVVLVLTWLVLTRGQPVPNVHPERVGESPDPLRSVDALRMLACGLVALPVVWLIAVNDLRGQAVMAAVLGGMAAGIVGRMAAPHVQPMILPAGVVLAGTAALWVTGTMLPEDVAVAWARGDVPNLARLTPIDWAAGALLGTPLGFGWGGGFLKHEGESVAA
ncbi:MAG: hypothetical protein QF733_05780 [Phycisphaerales bacterium]|jgi:hypothetical protein|nr:hypothetical protein [Phycisphaerales bacterium]